VSTLRPNSVLILKGRTLARYEASDMRVTHIRGASLFYAKGGPDLELVPLRSQDDLDAAYHARSPGPPLLCFEAQTRAQTPRSSPKSSPQIRKRPSEEPLNCLRLPVGGLTLAIMLPQFQAVSLKSGVTSGMVANKQEISFSLCNQEVPVTDITVADIVKCINTQGLSLWKSRAGLVSLQVSDVVKCYHTDSKVSKDGKGKMRRKNCSDLLFSDPSLQSALTAGAFKKNVRSDKPFIALVLKTPVAMKLKGCVESQAESEQPAAARASGQPGAGTFAAEQRHGPDLRVNEEGYDSTHTVNQNLQCIGTTFQSQSAWRAWLIRLGLMNDTKTTGIKIRTALAAFFATTDHNNFLDQPDYTGQVCAMASLVACIECVQVLRCD
jgi:hypothetical protein